MRKTIISSMCDSTVSKHFQSRIGLEGKPDKVADFCLNKCPHADEEDCKGTCKEYAEFAKKYAETHKEGDNAL